MPRKIVGWAVSARSDSELVVAAMSVALEQERPGVGLLAHSDRGVQYASDRFQALSAQHGIVCSVIRKGNCWDNAPTESLVATIKKELVHHVRYATRDEARRSPFEYIEVFYNRQRRHSALDCQTPTPSRRGRNKDEGRGGLGERGRSSPKSKNNRGAAAPLVTSHHEPSAHFLRGSPGPLGPAGPFPHRVMS
jgi:transposase InsO family protein